jgi:hypothetical protein
MPATTTTTLSERAGIFAFAAIVLALVVGSAFAVGWLIGRVLL